MRRTQVVLSKSDAINLVGNFFPDTWGKLKEEEIQVDNFSKGYGNTLYVAERSAASDSDPTKVLIRKYGGNALQNKDEMGAAGEVNEVLIFNEMSRNGLGPKLYGVFPGGRVEQFINCHMLTPKESLDPKMARDVALNLARFHATQLPLSKRPRNFPSIGKGQHEKFIKNGTEEFLNRTDLGSKENLELLAHHDFNAEFDWLQDKISSIASRVVLMHSDMNYMNVLVRDDEPTGDELKILLVDYEFTGYGYRGVDIGGFFIKRIIDFSVENSRSGLEYPDEEYMKNFIKIYLDETKRLGYLNDFDENGLDSVDHVLMEAQIQSITWSMAMFICYSRNIFMHFPSGQKVADLMAFYLRNCLKIEESLKTKYGWK